MREFLIIFLLCLSLLGESATYYISPDGTNLSARDGSINQPWQTLSYACTRVTSPGNIIHVLPGAYIETSQSTLAVGVSIEGEGDNSIIRANIGGTTSLVSLYSSAVGTNGNQSISYLKFDGNNYTGFNAIYIGRRGGVTIHNCTIQDFDDHAIMIEGAGDANNRPGTYCIGNKVQDCFISNSCKVIPPKNEGESTGAITINGQQDCLIYNNRIYGLKAEATNGFLIKSVAGHNIGLKIYNNDLRKTQQTAYSDPLTWDFIIELWNSCGGTEIYNNTINGGSIDISGGFGQVKGSYAYSNWIHDNIIGQPILSNSENTCGILVEQSHDATIIERNHIKNVAYCGVWMPVYPDHVTNCTIKNLLIQNNIFENIGTSAIQVGGQENGGVNTITGFNVYNNVMIGTTAYGTNYGVRIPVQGGVISGVNIKNNIIQNFDSYPVSILAVTNSAIQNNIFYANGYNTPSQSGAIVSGNLTSNPLLTADYHLQSGSPAIDAGLNIGLPFSGTSPDIGAFEYVIIEPPPIHTTKGKLLKSSGKLIITKN